LKLGIPEDLNWQAKKNIWQIKKLFSGKIGNQSHFMAEKGGIWQVKF
jgi:hypothetical protein